MVGAKAPTCTEKDYMAKRTLNALADLIEDRCDKDQADVTFDSFVKDCLNLTVQEIASHVNWAEWLMDEASLTATVSGTQYIVMPADMDIHSLISITDRSNANRKVRRITPQEADLIDPGRDQTGDEILWWYQRVETTSPTFEDRIYFLNQPDSADTLSAIFGTFPPTVSTGSSSFTLPEKYEWILIEGALEKVWDRLDPDNPSRSDRHRERFQTGLQIIIRDSNSPREESGLHGHRPLRNVSGIGGASFPANFDVS